MARKSLSQRHSQLKACRRLASLTTELSVKANNWEQPRCPGIVDHEQVVVSLYNELHTEMRMNQLCTVLQNGSIAATQCQCKKLNKSAHCRIPQTQSPETELMCDVSSQESGYLRAATEGEMRRTSGVLVRFCLLTSSLCILPHAYNVCVHV